MKSKFDCKTCNGAGTIELEDERFCTGCPHDSNGSGICGKYTVRLTLYAEVDRKLYGKPLRLSQCIEQSIQEAADKGPVKVLVCRICGNEAYEPGVYPFITLCDDCKGGK